MNIASQLWNVIGNRGGTCKARKPLEELTTEELHRRKKRVKDEKVALGMMWGVALFINTFALYDRPELLILFVGAVIGVFTTLFADYRKKMKKIDEQLNRKSER